MIPTAQPRRFVRYHPLANFIALVARKAFREQPAHGRDRAGAPGLTQNFNQQNCIHSVHLWQAIETSQTALRPKLSSRRGLVS